MLVLIFSFDKTLYPLYGDLRQSAVLLSASAFHYRQYCTAFSENVLTRITDLFLASLLQLVWKNLHSNEVGIPNSYDMCCHAVTFLLYSCNVSSCT